ncbi:hypothetical protein [uncultured Paracoccus sp.]|uniref:hypothetical protein n=1 Tax=uncultured Paracoccus sp. TaxID=189685 RepID=UPI002621D568|nr:hypothetical protein [uncultured Paracoccus sp.]
MTDDDNQSGPGDKASHVTVHLFSPNRKVRSFPADQGTQTRWESIRQLILGKVAELAARNPKPEPVERGPVIVLRGEPDPFDVEAWKLHLEEYRSDEPSSFRDAVIEYAEGHIRALGGDHEKSRADGQ